MLLWVPEEIERDEAAGVERVGVAVADHAAVGEASCVGVRAAPVAVAGALARSIVSCASWFDEASVSVVVAGDDDGVVHGGGGCRLERSSLNGGVVVVEDQGTSVGLGCEVLEGTW